MTAEPHVARRGHGTPILLIHGNGVDHRLLIPLDDVLAEAGMAHMYLVYLDSPEPRLAGYDRPDTTGQAPRQWAREIGPHTSSSPGVYRT